MLGEAACNNGQRGDIKLKVQKYLKFYTWVFAYIYG